MKSAWFILCSVAVLAGCAAAPMGPTTSVMPAPGKPFDVFAQEDQQCRQYAASASGAEDQHQATNQAATSMAAGTLLGAAAGALMGGHQGAAVGAGMGLVVGTAAGSGQVGREVHDAQWRYNEAYRQCMYAKGNQVPGFSVQQYTPPPQQ